MGFVRIKGQVIKLVALRDSDFTEASGSLGTLQGVCIKILVRRDHRAIRLHMQILQDLD